MLSILKNNSKRNIIVKMLSLPLLPPRPVVDSSKLVITNWVCTAEIRIEMCIQLMSLLAYGMGGRCDSKVFPPIVIRSKFPAVTCEIFPTGKIVAAGARSHDIARLALHQCVAKLSTILKIPVIIYNVEVQNVVGKMSLGCALNLDLLVDDYPLKTSYEKSKFPGVHAYLKNETQCLVIFKNGSLVTTGNLSTTGAQNSVEVGFERYFVGYEYRKLNTSKSAPTKPDESKTEQMASTEPHQTRKRKETDYTLDSSDDDDDDDDNDDNSTHDASCTTDQQTQQKDIDDQENLFNEFERLLD
jgi:TATA-box binding protein (TBP) (component of TFIID and TFIIIB)